VATAVRQQTFLRGVEKQQTQPVWRVAVVAQVSVQARQEQAALAQATEVLTVAVHPLLPIVAVVLAAEPQVLVAELVAQVSC